MQVTVIIPTYNRAGTLGRAIESVLKQNVPLEIIVVDDGSTDGTRETVVVAGFKPAPAIEMRYLHQPNRGPAAARNLGIRHARGEFIAFLDSDDEWLPGKLAAELRFFEENPDYLICQTEEIWIRNGRRVNPMKKHKKYGGSIFEKCLPLCMVSPSAVMVKRELFDEVGLFDESLPACEDYDLWLRVSARFPIGLIEKPYVVKYGGHPDQRSREFPVMDRFRIQALEKLLESGVLTPEQRESALRELKRKCEIVSRGAMKRGRLETLSVIARRREAPTKQSTGSGQAPQSTSSEIASAAFGGLAKTAPAFRPRKIYVEKSALNCADVGTILSRLPGVPVEEIEEGKTGTVLSGTKRTVPVIGEGKRSLLLARDRGRAFKPFPTPEGTVSCDFYSLNLVEGCDLECSYCILQAYLTNPLLTVYVNTDEILDSLEAFLRAHPDQAFRIGTGQLADSLSLDPVTAHTEVLVPFFARQENAVLELKTKSSNIARLQNLDSAGRTIVSWSMNTKRIQREEEHKCASIEERIEAARQCVAWGYRVGFHFDPLIDYEGCLPEYEEVLEEIFEKIRPDEIAWVSFGSLRFMPRLKKIMEERFPKSPLPYAEWVRGTDGKLRYFKQRRIELYRSLVSRLRELAPSVLVYLCMETEEVWNETLGGARSPEETVRCLNERARDRRVPSFRLRLAPVSQSTSQDFS